MLDMILIGVALVLDSLLGEPQWLWSRVPHPVRIMGAGITKLDHRLNLGEYKRGKGVLL